MIKNPIPKVTNQKQFRAIGIVLGTYKPLMSDCLNKGFLKDINGFDIDAVVLGKALPLIKKSINLEKQYYWIVYPRNKNSDNLHFQIAGIWDPNNFDVSHENNIKKTDSLLHSLDLKNNLFSIRGKLVYVNISQKELIIKICISKPNKNLKNKSFKVLVKGNIPMSFLNSFISIVATRKNNTLFMDDFEIIEEKLSAIE